MKLLGEGGIPKPLVMYGELKSSISSLKMIPVDPDMTLEPKLGNKKKKKKKITLLPEQSAPCW